MAPVHRIGAFLLRGMQRILRASLHIGVSMHRAALLLLLLCSTLAFARHPRPCITAEQATKLINKDVCVTAHIYDVVQLPDGTRYLDVCAPGTPDAECRFTIISLDEDRDEVGELQKFRDTDVHIRGVIRSMRGRAGIVLSHVRQFYGGPPRFKPNPKLMHGFSGDQDRPPLRDPGLHAHPGRRNSVNSLNREPLNNVEKSAK